MNGDVSRRSLVRFFLLGFALAAPLWLVGGTTELRLLPGLPIAALATICPVLAAIILIHRDGKWPGVIALLRRSFDFNRVKSKTWYMLILLLMPLVTALSFVAMRLSGSKIPVPNVNALAALVLCTAFFAGALGEELGWSGYAIDPAQERWGAMAASIVMGTIWAVYHYVALMQAHRSFGWIAAWSLYTVASRMILVWLYNNTGKSVFAAAFFHMTINVTRQLFPINGSYFDPGVTGLILALAAAVIVRFWGPRTLAPFRYAKPRYIRISQEQW